MRLFFISGCIRLVGWKASLFSLGRSGALLFDIAPISPKTRLPRQRLSAEATWTARMGGGQRIGCRQNGSAGPKNIWGSSSVGKQNSMQSDSWYQVEIWKNMKIGKLKKASNSTWNIQDFYLKNGFRFPINQFLDTVHVRTQWVKAVRSRFILITTGSHHQSKFNFDSIQPSEVIVWCRTGQLNSLTKQLRMKFNLFVANKGC